MGERNGREAWCSRARAEAGSVVTKLVPFGEMELGAAGGTAASTVGGGSERRSAVHDARVRDQNCQSLEGDRWWY